MKKTIYEETIFYSLFLMQSYGDFGLIPRKCANSSLTCMDNRLDNGQIGETDQKVVHYLCCLRLIR